jgi:hypothetical protein
MDDLDFGHRTKLPAERDADIVKASTILIVAGPCPGDPIHAATSGSGAANRAPGTAVREIFYLQAAGVQREPSSQTGGSKRATYHAAATTGVKDAGWATRQGREDRKAGTPCGSYKGFRGRYNLVKSEKTMRCGYGIIGHRGRCRIARSAKVLSHVSAPFLRARLPLAKSA